MSKRTPLDFLPAAVRKGWDSPLCEPGDHRVRPGFRRSASGSIRLKNSTARCGRSGGAWRTAELARQAASQPMLQCACERRIETLVGATARKVIGLGEVSGAGLRGEIGVLLFAVPS
jgi:hypothetical protein